MRVRDAVVALVVVLGVVEIGGRPLDVAGTDGVLEDAVVTDGAVGGVEVTEDATLLDGMAVADWPLEVELLTTKAGSLPDPVLLVGGGLAVELHAASESVTAAISPARSRLMLCTSFA